MRGRLKASGTFLFALALGIWVGASWHTAVHSNAEPEKFCGCCQRLCAANPNKKTNPIITTTAPERAPCAACIAGAQTCDSDGVQIFASVEVPPPAEAAPLMSAGV